jgi:hypothetical protein
MIRVFLFLVVFATQSILFTPPANAAGCGDAEIKRILGSKSASNNSSISIPVKASTADNPAFKEGKWKKLKLDENFFGPDVFEIRDTSFGVAARSSFVRYGINPADNISSKPYIEIQMLRGDPERPGLGQHLLNEVMTANPGVPIYSVLSFDNGAKAKLAFREIASLGSTQVTAPQVEKLLANIPAFRSIPGKVQLKPVFSETGELKDIGVLRSPDPSGKSVEIENLNELMTDPRFQKWMQSLSTRDDSYFQSTPEFFPSSRAR